MAVEKKPRVRVSKNRKKNWNKYCDIKDVEDYLEEKRLEERIGGPVSDRKSSDLFFIQTDTSKDAPEKKKKQLRCFQGIGSYTKVPVPCKVTSSSYSKRIQNRLTRADLKISKKAEKIISPKKKKDGENLQVSGVLFFEPKDLWAEDDKVDPEIEPLVKFRDEYTRKKGPNVPGHRFQKPSFLPAVEVPHPGASYNPTFEEHQELLQEALVVEQAKVKDELHLKRVLTDMFPSKENAPTQESMLQEMSQGLFDEEETEENEVKNNFHLRNPPVSSEDRISKARKRRKKERKEQERLKNLEKGQKKALNEIYRLRSIKKEIKKKEEITKQRVEKKIQKRIDKMYKPNTLGTYKYEAPDLELKLSDEMSGSLRTLKSEGNLLEDRYKSLQRRNIIEPRIKQKMRRRYKLKLQVKRSHRDPTSQ